MQVDFRPDLSEGQREAIRKHLQDFEIIKQEGDSVLASGEKSKLEAFMSRHAEEIERGLIAAPGSVVRTQGGSTYDVAEDGSWRKR